MTAIVIAIKTMKLLTIIPSATACMIRWGVSKKNM